MLKPGGICGEIWNNKPLAVTVGVPAYLNGYAAIPVVAGLMQTGMAPGAAMAFMIAGAMTSIPAAIAGQQRQDGKPCPVQA